jgi:hypothetical protein
VTLPNEQGAARYTGDGLTSDYAFGFYTQNLDDVRVLVQNADGLISLLVRNTHYTITGERQDTGLVTLIAGYSPLPDGWGLAILLWPELNNESVFRNSPTVSRAQLEDAIDRMSQRIIRLADADTHALRVSEMEAGGADLVLPPPANRAGGLLGFDVDGVPEIFPGPGQTVDDPDGPESAFTAENKDSVTIQKGQAVTIHSSGVGVIRADADLPGAPCDAIAGEDVAPGFSGTFITAGSLDQPDWTNVIGAPSLAAKATYYLSRTPGRLVATPDPAGFFTQSVGRQVGPTTLDVSIKSKITY